MSYIFPLESYGGDPIEIIPVIASYDGEGHIKPLYARINDNRYRVESCWVKSNSMNNIDYHCKLSFASQTYVIVITYHIRECVWTVLKFLVKKEMNF